MEEITVTAAPEAAPSIDTPATVFAFEPEGDTAPAVDAPDGEQAADNEPARAEVQEPSEKEKTQKDTGEAFRRESERIRKKAEREYEQKMASDPAARIGRMMIQDLVNSKGLTAEEAANQATENLLAAIAKRDNIPLYMAKQMYGGEVKQEMKAAAKDAAEPTQEQVDGIIENLMKVDLPDGFDIASAVDDDVFQELLLKHDADKAVRIYNRIQVAERSAKTAPQAVADQLRARSAIPQTMRPSQPASPNVDYTDPAISDEDFAKIKAARRRNY